VSVHVFLGPTLAVADAQAVWKDMSTKLDDAPVFHPPVQQGDVLRLLSRRPSVIGIVDGYFELVPAVWHKEILAAMAAGVHVFGAASMGALRAAELQSFGMIGVGQIFRWFHEGTIVADDEVAVTHGPAEAGYRRFSEALVDIRDACAAAVAVGVVPAEVGKQLVEVAAALHYSERAYPRVAAEAGRAGLDPVVVDGWLQFVRERGPGLKQRDAVALLEAIANFRASAQGPKQVDYEVAETVFLAALRNEVTLVGAAGLAGPPESEHTRLRGRDSVAGLRRRGLLRVLAREEAERRGWTLTQAEVQRCADRFRHDRGLAAVPVFLNWLEREGLSEDMFWDLINSECLIVRLLRLHGHEIDAVLTDELRLSSADP
jgi:hypothetical protein